MLRALDELNDVRMNRAQEAPTLIRTNGKELSAQLPQGMKDQLDLGDLSYLDRALKVPLMLSYPSHTAFAKPGNDSGRMPISCNTDSLDLSQAQTARRSGGALDGSGPCCSSGPAPAITS